MTIERTTCEYCNGTHVYHAWDESKVLFQPCPVCGPELEKKFWERMQEFRKKLREARLRSEKEGNNEHPLSSCEA